MIRKLIVLRGVLVKSLPYFLPECGKPETIIMDYIIIAIGRRSIFWFSDL
jgi:hypothetical protein